MISTSEEAATPEIAEGFLPEDMRCTPTLDKMTLLKSTSKMLERLRGNSAPMHDTSP